MCRFIMLLLLVAICNSFAQTVKISGLILDSISMKPIPDAQITLVGFPAISTTSDDSGKFTLDGSAKAVSHNALKLTSIGAMVYGNCLKICNVQEADQFIVSVFNLNGNRLYSAKKQIACGSTGSFSDLWKTSGVYFVRIQVGQYNKLYKFSALSFNSNAPMYTNNSFF
jgi:hypothetical protein